MLSAALLYIPANVLPVMSTQTFFSDEDDTIMSGVISLATLGLLAARAVGVFREHRRAAAEAPRHRETSSSRSRANRARYRRQRSRLFRIVEFIGRWSMLDVFAISLLVTLVQVQSFAAIRVRLGALAFAAVVVLTMLAAQSFDERLLWDTPSDG